MKFDPIPHYHGDSVRVLFVLAAVLMFLVIPIWGPMLPFGLGTEVLAGVILILLAGFTSPHSPMVLWLDCFAAGAGAFLLEFAAVVYRSQPGILLAVREIAALLLLAALYQSVKTVRAMAQGKVGELPRPWEFEKPTAGDSY